MSSLSEHFLAGSPHAFTALSRHLSQAQRMIGPRPSSRTTQQQSIAPSTGSLRSSCAIHRALGAPTQPTDPLDRNSPAHFNSTFRLSSTLCLML
jgi:hypothetical protein